MQMYTPICIPYHSRNPWLIFELLYTPIYVANQSHTQRQLPCVQYIQTSKASQRYLDSQFYIMALSTLKSSYTKIKATVEIREVLSTNHKLRTVSCHYPQRRIQLMGSISILCFIIPWMRYLNHEFPLLIITFLFLKRMGCQSSQEVAPSNPQERSIQLIPPGFDQFLAQSNFSEIEKIGDGYFKQGKYLQAIAVYTKAIEAGYSVDFEIGGLGNFDIETYNFEWWAYKWYDEQRTTGKLKGNMFDALSLCYCRIKESNVEELEKGVMWYQDMLSEKQTYELYMGYANILYNKYLYDHALKTYNKVIAMRPSLVNAYVSMMFLHEFKRVEKPKAIALANTVLSKDPDNKYAYFVLGKNQKDVDQKIKKLQEAAQKYPNYIRLVNEVGLSYGGKKDHKMAIFWYKKCLVLAGQFYAQGYNNVAFRTEMLQDYPQALDYYYKAVQIDPMYKMAFTNAIKLFNKLNFTDDDIIKKMKEYPKMDEFNFYYYLGLAYYDMGGRYINNAITWYKRAEAINPKSFNLYNSFGLAYDSQQRYDEGEQCYFKSMSLSPKYKYPPYNLGLLYKHKGQVDKAIEWYHKSIENDPNYHPPYNNLANIYRDKQEYKKAIELYRKGLEINSTYTLSYCNMAICLLKQEMYQDAFNALARAKELLPTDTNGLSEANKNFLKENIAKFDIQGEKWRKTGSIGLEQKEKLQSLIKSFQSNFKLLYSGQTTFKRSEEIVLKPAILQIIKLIHQDKFELTNIDQIFTMIKNVFHDDEEYFHIIPQIFIQYFYNSSFIKKKPILDVEAKLFSIIKDFSSREASLLGPAEGSAQSQTIAYKMKNFTPPKEFKVNLFKNTSYFKDYQVLYSEIDKINKLTEKHLVEYIDFVDGIRRRSNGIPYGTNMKMPKRADQQFKVILRILQKMFKKELTQQRVKSIISKIDKHIRATQGKVTLINIVHEIMEVWTKEITLILQERENAKVETTCAISDLLRGKIMFHNVNDLERAIEACDKLCYLNGYSVLELDNRLSKPQTQDVVLKIQVGDAVCELQLALKQDESKYHFIHSIYEIERSPLGCIFGSYLFMSKGFNYPLLANCKDIAARLKDNTDGKDKATLEAANFIIVALEEN